MDRLARRFLVAALLILMPGMGLHQNAAAGMGVHPIEIRPIEPFRPIEKPFDPNAKDPFDNSLHGPGRLDGHAGATSEADARVKALELIRDQLGKLSNPVPGSDFKPVLEGNTIWFESPRYKGLRFSYEALAGGEAWLANAIRGPPIVINLAGPKAKVTGEIEKLPDDQKNNIEIHKIDLSDNALQGLFNSIDKGRAVVILTHVRQVDGQYLFSTVDESASISWSRVQELQKEAGIDAITMGCRSACLPDAKAGVPNVFNQFDAIAAIKALNNHISSTADLLRSVSVVADTALHVNAHLDVGVPRVTVEGRAKDGSPIIGYLPMVQGIALNATNENAGNLPGPLQQLAKGDLCRGSDGSRDAQCLRRICLSVRPAFGSPGEPRFRIIDGKIRLVTLLTWNCDNEAAQWLTLAYSCLDPRVDLVKSGFPERTSPAVSRQDHSLDPGFPAKADPPGLPAWLDGHDQPSKQFLSACLQLRSSLPVAPAASISLRERPRSPTFEVPQQQQTPTGHEGVYSYLSEVFFVSAGIIIGGMLAAWLLGGDDARTRRR
ncbi:exported hypothetical protein [Mesorhizobium sp. ORS 3324]|nr:exported hypothetical protein [Mesorhizobium sp. ORS 3324]